MFDFGNGQAMEGECGTATTGQFPGIDAEKETAVNTTEHNKTVFRGFENEYKDLRTSTNYTSHGTITVHNL